MPIIAKDSGGTMFDPAPQGVHRAVCCDVIDLGEQDTKFGRKHKVRIVWETEEENPSTRERYQVRSTYTLSLNEKSSLSRDLESWRGRKFTDEERRKGFDLSSLIGSNCQLQVIHNESSNGRTYANIQTVIPPQKGVDALVPRDYNPSEREGQGHADEEPFA